MRAVFKEFCLKYKGGFWRSTIGGFFIFFVIMFVAGTWMYFRFVYSDDSDSYSFSHPEEYYHLSWKGWWHHMTSFYFMWFVYLILLIAGFLLVVGVPTMIISLITWIKEWIQEKWLKKKRINYDETDYLPKKKSLLKRVYLKYKIDIWLIVFLASVSAMEDYIFHSAFLKWNRDFIVLLFCICLVWEAFRLANHILQPIISWTKTIIAKTKKNNVEF